MSCVVDGLPVGLVHRRACWVCGQGDCCVRGAFTREHEDGKLVPFKSRNVIAQLNAEK